MKKKFLEQSSKYMPYVLLAGLALLFVITRFWRITTLPSGVHIDEAGMAYDAWCLSQYGVDRYFKSYPLLLTNFGGGGQSALCIYTTALLFRLFGFHSFLFRVTNIFYSLLTVVFGMLILRKLYPDRPYLAIAGGYLMTILPFFCPQGLVWIVTRFSELPQYLSIVFSAHCNRKNIVIMYWPASPEGLFYTPIPSLISYCHLFLF